MREKPRNLATGSKFVCYFAPYCLQAEFLTLNSFGISSMLSYHILKGKDEMELILARH